MIPYMVLVMYCACPFCKYLVYAMPQIDKNASSVPKLTNGKWPVSLGRLKRVVGSFPIILFNMPLKNLIYVYSLSLVTKVFSLVCKEYIIGFAKF